MSSLFPHKHVETALSPGLLTPPSSLRLARNQPATWRCQLLTLLFLEAVGLRRTWDLRGYSGQALALLTGRDRAYSYRHAERFLAELARVGEMCPHRSACMLDRFCVEANTTGGESILLPSFTWMATASLSMPIR